MNELEHLQHQAAGALVDFVRSQNKHESAKLQLHHANYLVNRLAAFFVATVNDEARQVQHLDIPDPRR